MNCFHVSELDPPHVFLTIAQCALILRINVVLVRYDDDGDGDGDDDGDDDDDLSFRNQIQ